MLLLRCEKLEQHRMIGFSLKVHILDKNFKSLAFLIKFNILILMVSNLTTVISRTNSTNQMRQKTKSQMKIFETQILLVAVGFTLRQDTELFYNYKREIERQ